MTCLGSLRCKVACHRPTHGPLDPAPQSRYSELLRQHTSPGIIADTFPCQNPFNASISSLYYTLARVALARDTVASHITHTRPNLNLTFPRIAYLPTYKPLGANPRNLLGSNHRWY